MAAVRIMGCGVGGALLLTAWGGFGVGCQRAWSGRPDPSPDGLEE